MGQGGGAGGCAVGCSKSSPNRTVTWKGFLRGGGAVNNNSAGLGFIPRKAMDADRETAQTELG